MSFDRMAYILQVTPSFGPEYICPACKGAKLIEHIGEYETLYEDNKRLCPLCLGSGVHRDRFTIMEREALAIFNDLLPEEGMLYPTITPGELTKLRDNAAPQVTGNSAPNSSNMEARFDLPAASAPFSQDNATGQVSSREQIPEQSGERPAPAAPTDKLSELDDANERECTDQANLKQS